MTNTEHHYHSLRQLGSDLVSGVLGLRAFRAEVTALLRERFDCDQVVLWRTGRDPQDRQFRCVAERHGERVDLDGDHRLSVPEMHAYLEHLLRSGAYTAPARGALDGPIGSQALRMHPSGASNMLHAAATYNGRILGIVCCERNDPHRGWSPVEQVELRRMAARIALYVGTLAEREAETTEAQS